MNEQSMGTNPEIPTPKAEKERIAREEATRQIEEEIRGKNISHDQDRQRFVDHVASSRFNSPSQEKANQTWLDGERSKAERAIEYVVAKAHRTPKGDLESGNYDHMMREYLDEIIDNNYLNYYGGSRMKDNTELLGDLMHLRRQERITKRAQELVLKNN